MFYCCLLQGCISVTVTPSVVSVLFLLKCRFYYVIRVLQLLSNALGGLCGLFLGTPIFILGQLFVIILIDYFLNKSNILSIDIKSDRM